MSGSDEMGREFDEREAQCLRNAETVRNSPEFRKIFEDLAAFAETMNAERGIPAWLVQGVFNDEMRTSRFYQMAVDSLNGA